MINPVSDDQKMLARFRAVIESQHWSAAYIKSLLIAHHRSGSIDFNTAEQLLLAEKNQFEHDLATARRMLRLYGEQIPREKVEKIAIAAAAGSSAA